MIVIVIMIVIKMMTQWVRYNDSENDDDTVV